MKRVLSIHIPIKDTSRLTEVFRRQVIKHFVDRGAALPQFCGRNSAARSFTLKVPS